MAEHDEVRWPGGCMTGFILWISSQMLKFFRAHPEAFGRKWDGAADLNQMFDDVAWDKWLQNQA
jgi:hypothetical protein